jgi:hypothetical protein
MEEQSLRGHDRAEMDKIMALQEASGFGEEVGAVNSKIEVTG